MQANIARDVPAVEVLDLVKWYRNGVQANRGISLTVAQGEIIAIAGPNGAGKTTLFRQLTADLESTSGEVRVFGVNVLAEPLRAKGLMGITPQESGFFDTLTAERHIALFGRLKGLSGSECDAQSSSLLAELDLAGHSDKLVRDLSGGQRRRILIALALIGEPPLLVLDEPTSGLDPVSRLSVWGALKRRRERGAAVIVSTHYMEEAERLCDRVAFINEGRIVAMGTAAQLRSALSSNYRLQYVTNGSAPPRTETLFFETFGQVEEFIRERSPGEYQIATSTLEDVYVSIVGQRSDTDAIRPGGGH